MKIFLTSAMLFFLLLFSFLSADDSFDYFKDKIAVIDHQLNTYEFEGAEYHLDFNYHVGYISGQRKAYLDTIEELSLSIKD